MGNLKRWTAVTAGATVCLAGIVGVGAGLAGAAPSGDAMRQASDAALPSHVPVVPGTYEWFVNGGAAGTISLASNNTFTSTVDTNDSGTWEQAGNTFGMWITGGTDGAAACVFAGHVNTTGTGMSTAAHPGSWACPGYGSSGTFYIGPVAAASATQAHSDAFARLGVQPRTSANLLLGRYKWTEDGYYSGIMTIAAGNTYTSTLSGNDSGSWVQNGSAAAFSITGGVDSGIGCLSVGKVNTTGTDVGTATNPGNWACPGTGTTGYFVLKYKG
jgi:hypothetical protein